MLLIEKKKNKFNIYIFNKLFFVFMCKFYNKNFSIIAFSQILLNKILRMFGLLGVIKKNKLDFF